MAFNIQKIILIIVALELTFEIVTATSLIKGVKEPGDTEICSKYIDVPARPDRVLEEYYTCKVHGLKQKISYISAIDMSQNGKSGFAKIYIGGVDRKKVTLLLTSQTGQPLKFNIQVYAKNHI